MMKRKMVVLGYCLLSLAILFGLFRVTLHLRAAYCLANVPGIPASIDELAARYPEVPDNTNGALLYLQAFEIAKENKNYSEELPFYSAELPPLTEPIPEAMCKAMESWLDDSYLRLLHEAADSPQSRYPSDLLREDRPSVHTPLLHAIKDLCMEALVEADRGQGEPAMQAILAGFAAERSIRGYPVPITPLVRIAGFGVLMQAMERVLARVNLSEESLQKLYDAVAASDIHEDVTRGLEGGLCLSAQDFADPAIRMEEIAKFQDPFSISPEWGMFRWRLYVWSGLADLDHASYINIVREWLEISEEPFPDCFARVRTLQENVNALPAWRSRITRILLPHDNSVSSFFDAEADHLARRSVVQSVIAMERTRMDFGKLPEIPGEPPPDPFDGRPLRYQRKGAGYVLYSIGRNRLDDGGVRKTYGLREGDIVFEVIR